MAVSGRGNENATASVCVCDRLAARESERERNNATGGFFVATALRAIGTSCFPLFAACLRLVCGLLVGRNGPARKGLRMGSVGHCFGVWRV